MLKNSQTESFFQKFFIFFFLPGGLTPAKSGKHQHSASKRNRQRHLCMQDILCRLESNRNRFRSYVPAAVPNPLQALVLTCPGFSFFCTYFFPPYRCIGIFLNLSLSALIPDGREEQSVCSVLVAPCIRSSSCSFLIAVFVASSINANLSLSIFFLPFCSFGFLLHIQYAGILGRGYFFCGFFLCMEFFGIRLRIWLVYKKENPCICYRPLPAANEIARLSAANEY